MLIVSARKLCNPIVALIEMKTGDVLIHDLFSCNKTRISMRTRNNKVALNRRFRLRA